MPPGWVWPPSEAMLEEGRRCLSELAATRTPFARLNQTVGKISMPVTVPAMVFGGLAVRPIRGADRAIVMDCHLALSLVQQGPRLAELGIRAIIVGGIHDDRRARLGGRSLNILSRHAVGLGVDIRAFETSDGRVLSVSRHYGHPLLQQVEATLNALDSFRAVVTPGNDRGHHNHFHLSAKMTIDAARPDETVDVASVLKLAGAAESKDHGNRDGSADLGPARVLARVSRAASAPR